MLIAEKLDELGKPAWIALKGSKVRNPSALSVCLARSAIFARDAKAHPAATDNIQRTRPNQLSARRSLPLMPQARRSWRCRALRARAKCANRLVKACRALVARDGKLTDRIMWSGQPSLRARNEYPKTSNCRAFFSPLAP
jgi:hypothetical protein